MPDDTQPISKKPSQSTAATTRPLAAPICPATVYCCDSPEQASQLLAGETEGFVYSRDGHPNARALAARCSELHGANEATITGSGMAALALAMVSQLEKSDHVVVSSRMYGRSLTLFTTEAHRFGIEATVVDTCDLAAVQAAMTESTRMLAVETIANPMLRVANISALADVAHAAGAVLLVDNTFASPALCCPLSLGADLAMESITKIMNGHSDVMLGLLCGHSTLWDRVTAAQTTWGFFASPMDCWLASRGMETLGLRVDQASTSARGVAEHLKQHGKIIAVHYPGLADSPDHQLAAEQLAGRFGNMVTVELQGGRAAADRFIAAVADSIPFCPSLGELVTTLSHPESTSHRGLTEDERLQLGITGGMIRLSVGIEPPAGIIAALDAGLRSVG